MKAPMVVEEDEEFESSVRRPPETTTEGRVVNRVMDMEGGNWGLGRLIRRSNV